MILHSNLQVSWDLEYFLLVVHEEGEQACGEQLIQVLLLCTAQDTAGERLDQLQNSAQLQCTKLGIDFLLSTLQWLKSPNTNFQVGSHKEKESSAELK